MSDLSDFWPLFSTATTITCDTYEMDSNQISLVTRSPSFVPRL